MDNNPFKDALEKEHKRICPLIKDKCITNNCEFWQLKIGQLNDCSCLIIDMHRNMRKKNN